MVDHIKAAQTELENSKANGDGQRATAAAVRAVAHALLAEHAPIDLAVAEAPTPTYGAQVAADVIGAVRMRALPVFGGHQGRSFIITEANLNSIAAHFEAYQ